MFQKSLNNSDGSGSKFFGFGLRSGMRFRVGFYRVSIAKQVSGLIGFGFKVKINFRVFGFQKNQILEGKMASYCKRLYLDFQDLVISD